MKNFIRKNKGLFSLSIVLILLFIGLIFLGLNYQRKHALNSNKENLQILANEKAAQVNTFLESQKEKLLILNSMDVFKEVALYPNDSSKVEAAKNMINNLKGTTPGITVSTTEEIVIVGDIDVPGTDYSGQPYSLLKEKRIVFERYYCPQRKKDYYAVVGPIYDGLETNKIIGTIAFDIKLDKISVLMEETLDSKTKEVYLIDETGLLLSGSKYISDGNKDGVLIQEVKSDGAKACLEDLKKYQKDGAVKEHEEKITEYLNYMGDKVFGMHVYVSTIMGCVIAEESTDEVAGFSLINNIKNLIY